MSPSYISISGVSKRRCLFHVSPLFRIPSFGVQVMTFEIPTNWSVSCFLLSYTGGSYFALC